MTAKPDEIAGREETEPFVSRWSRLKDEARRQPPEPAREKSDPNAVAPELPPLDKLTLESDYRGFFHPKVSEEMRRGALKKLFSDPHFNVMDGLDVYIDDYSKTEPIPPAMMAGLRQAQKILGWAKEDEEKRAQDALAANARTPALEATEAQPAPDVTAPANAPEAISAPPGGAGGPAKP